MNNFARGAWLALMAPAVWATELAIEAGPPVTDPAAGSPAQTLAVAELAIESDSAARCHTGGAKPYTFAVASDSAGALAVDIVSPDGDVVRSLPPVMLSEPGRAQFAWDLRDSRGALVPDEAYVPVATHIGPDGQATVLDPRATSGGEELKIPIVQRSADALVFDVPAPARVSIRAGTRNGPLLNNVLDFAPRPAGRNRIAWSGRDVSGVLELAEHEDLALVSTGFKLPDHAILCTGNRDLAYVDWHAEHYPPVQEPDLSGKTFERDGARIARYGYLPRSLLASPRLSLEVVGDWQRDGEGRAVVTGPVSFKVDVPTADLWALQQSQFEVAFYVDLEFISEQEQGYAPLTWRWLPGGTAPGRKLITVNVSGYNGQVAAQSLEIDFQPSAQGK